MRASALNAIWVCYILSVLASEAAYGTLSPAQPSSKNRLRGRANSTRPSNVTYVDYTRLQPLPEKIPDNERGDLYKKFQPYLKIKDGCLPYPAIDEEAKLSSGMSVDAPVSSVCNESDGQTYVRSRSYKKRYAIMYSWYMPRDVSWTESIAHGAGHRHEWENAVVWLDSKAPTTKTVIAGVTVSAHGGYISYAADELNYKQGSHALLAYDQPVFRVRNRQLQFNTNADDIGHLNALIAWENMNAKMHKALDTPNAFDGTTSGVRDTDFDGFIARSYAIMTGRANRQASNSHLKLLVRPEMSVLIVLALAM